MHIDQASYLSLMTIRKNGSEVLTPVWFATADSTSYYCFSAAEAGKVKRIRNNKLVKIATCDVRGGSLGGWVDCQAQLIDKLDEQALAYSLLIKKYGWQMRLTNFFSAISGKINKRRVIRLDVIQ